MTPQLVLQRRLPHPVERVWRAIQDGRANQPKAAE